MEDTKEHSEASEYKIDHKEYKQNWDRQRKANRAVMNMAFFTKILKSLKLNYKQFAENTGISQQLISWWLASDDCKYSNIVSTFEKIGFDIKCHYEPLPDSQFVIPSVLPENNYSILIDGVPIMADEDQERGQVINQVLAGNGKLKFLAEFIDGIGMDIKSFSEKIDSGYHVVYSWFRKDDMKISKINLVADRFQQKVVWTLKSI